MEQKTTLRKKLKEIEKKFKTFATCDEAEKKKNGSKESAYKYTPTWKIVEALRQEMDNQNVMLDMNVLSEQHEMICYPVYKMIGSEIRAFDKKEMYVTITCTFTWVDVDTNETLGPYMMTTSGANGIDKSISSALTLAEKYFLLKAFHITTREKSEEPDAHDSDTIPGIMSNSQPVSPADYKGGHTIVPAPTPNYTPQSQMPVPPQPMYQSPLPGMTPPAQAVSPEVAYENAVRALMNFEKGTKAHADMLAKLMVSLRLSGFNTADPAFATTLVETAQKRRNGNH